jgi:hypothetical protein
MNATRRLFFDLCDAIANRARIGDIAHARYALEQAEHIYDNCSAIDKVADAFYLLRAVRVLNKFKEKMSHAAV